MTDDEATHRREMGRRLAPLFAALSDGLSMVPDTARNGKPIAPLPRPKSPEQLAAEYATRPIGLSDELREKMRMEPKVGEGA